MFNNLGEELKEARLKSDLTLLQLASKTRIDLKFLEAMENGNFNFLPELYVRAFLKEYASFVGIDEVLILKKYEAAKQGKVYEEKLPVPDIKEEDKSEVKKEEPYKAPVPPLQTYSSVPTHPPSEEANSSNNKRLILGTIIVGAVILFGLLYFLFFRTGNEIIVPEKPIEEVIEDNQRFREEEPTGNTAGSAFADRADSLKLTIRTSDTLWVKIIIDDVRVEDFKLFPNGQKTVVASDNYKITIGKSSAVSLLLNDKPLQFSPRTTVSHLLVNSSGVSFLDSAPTIRQE